jgi:hypothetical protein
MASVWVVPQGGGERVRACLGVEFRLALRGLHLKLDTASEESRKQNLITR